jgi:hypothetical protein
MPRGRSQGGEGSTAVTARDRTGTAAQSASSAHARIMSYQPEACPAGRASADSRHSRPVSALATLPPSDPAPIPLLSRHATITWPNGMRLEVPAGYPATALKALIAAPRQAR